MYLGCRFYPFVYVEFSRIPLEKSGLQIFPCTSNCQTRVKARRAVVTRGDTGCPHFVMHQPPDEVGLGLSMTTEACRRRHIDSSLDEFSFWTLRHSTVAALEFHPGEP